MIKLIGRRACLLLLAPMLMGATLGAFNSTNTSAQDLVVVENGYEESGQPHGPWLCPDSDRCNTLGCGRRSYLDQTMVCSRWKKDQGQAYSCPSPVNCAQSPH